MPTTYPVNQADIYRYKREFKKATERARLRFAAGAIVIGVAMLALLIVALYQFQAWAL
jgi:hypothetical protein